MFGALPASADGVPGLGASPQSPPSSRSVRCCERDEPLALDLAAPLSITSSVGYLRGHRESAARPRAEQTSPSRDRSHLRGSCLRPPGFCLRTHAAALRGSATCTCASKGRARPGRPSASSCSPATRRRASAAALAVLPSPHPRDGRLRPDSGEVAWCEQSGANDAPATPWLSCRESRGLERWCWSSFGSF